MGCLQCGGECKNKFCSRSCAAKVNNRGVRRHGKTPAFKDCQVCGKQTCNPRFCSRKCAASVKTQQAFEKIRNGDYDLAWSGNAVLREFLITERGYKCQGCDNTEWRGQPIPLSVHHEDGDASNNDPNNIFLICLNCHGITPNYGRKNKKSARKHRYASVV